ncbi:MAG: hypothetical protein JWM46_868 [Candidatus Kaiserbacteria bacterium]|nr:hypothetical protein [Candidatus Kaiserbacteria bacterium]
MSGFRTPESQAEYERVLPEILSHGCPLCTKQAVESFVHWKIVTDDFPYNKIAKLHHVLTPLRHVLERELNGEERQEYHDIKEEQLEGKYEYVIEPIGQHRSVPGHFHTHLIVSLD